MAFIGGAVDVDFVCLQGFCADQKRVPEARRDVTEARCCKERERRFKGKTGSCEFRRVQSENCER